MYRTNTKNQETTHSLILKREIIVTADGSKTIYLPDWNEHYHSKHGAVQEAQHVFIKHGFQHRIESHLEPDSESKNKSISILEIGFGTGLNAFLTVLEANKSHVEIHYTGVEAFPVLDEELELLNYTATEEEKEIFKQLHKISWEKQTKLFENFWLQKQKKEFSKIDDTALYDLIYFDAFGVRVQPELWTEAIFKKMYQALKSKGVLVTYAAAGSVRRAMQASGFQVEKLPGPPGKREMLRASK